MAENLDSKSLDGPDGDENDFGEASGSGKEGDRASLYSSCGSLSFVITEELDKSPDAVNNEMMSYMTQSQYSQVIILISPLSGCIGLTRI